MAGSIGIDSLSPSVKRDTLTGIVEVEESPFDAIVKSVGRSYEDKEDLVGEIPTFGSGMTLGQGNNQSLGLGEEAMPVMGEIAMTAYDCAPNVGVGSLYDKHKARLEITTPMKALTYLQTMAVRDANLAYSRVWAALLTNSTYNKTFAAAANYDDGGATSDPTADLKRAKSTETFRADTVIMGFDVVDGLSTHPHIVSNYAMYDSDGGAVEWGAVIAYLKELGFKNVFIIDIIYNSAPLGATPVETRLAADLLWVGHGDDLVNVHPKFDEQDSVEEMRYPNKRKTEIYYNRWDAPKRPTKTKGCYITNAA